MRRPIQRPCLLVIAALSACLLPSGAHGDDTSTSEELVRFVPEDVTFCLVVQDLREHRERIAESPFIKAWGGSALSAVVKDSAPMNQLADVEKLLKEHLGVSAQQVLDDVLGDAVVLAFRVDPRKSGGDEGLVILSARNEQTLVKVIDRINRSATKLETRKHQGVKYVRRVEKSEEGFYLLQGKTFLYSGQESILQQAVSQSKRNGKTTCRIVEQIRDAKADKALLALWVNPRSFDDELRDKQAQAKGGEQAFLKTFSQCWSQLEALVASLEVERDVRFSLSLKVKPKGLPAGLRRFFEEAGAASDLWTRIPDDAFVAMALRLDVSAFLDMVASFQTKDDSRALHEELNRAMVKVLSRKDGVKTVLPFVGPDWGWYVAAPHSNVKTWFPAVVVAVRLQPGDKKPPVDLALWRSLQGAIWLAKVWYNDQNPNAPLTDQSFEHGKKTVPYLACEAGRKIGLEPAYGLHGGYLIVASSPRAWREFVDRKGVPVPAGEVPIFRISLKHLCGYLKSHGNSLVPFMAARAGVDEATMTQRLKALQHGLALLDRVELLQRAEEGKVRLTLRARFTEPLRK